MCLKLLQIKLWCYSHKKGWQVIDHSKKNHGNVLRVVVRSRNKELSTIVYMVIEQLDIRMNVQLWKG